jgi:hypothetical protein
MWSPLPSGVLPVRAAVPCGAAEVDTIIRLVTELRPRPVSVVVGTAADPLSRANGDRLGAAWTARGGVVLDTVSWPERAASWLRPARRFAGPGPDAWLVAATPAGWVGLGRRLAYSTDWSARRTVATAALADSVLIAAGGPDTFDGLRGAYTDGGSWEISRTLLVRRTPGNPWRPRLSSRADR